MSCRACRTVHTARLPGAEELAAFYADYYGEGSVDVPAFVATQLQGVVASFARFRGTGRLLDVGFGAGTLLDQAQLQGWSCWGSELSSGAVAAARARGWELHEGHVDALDAPAGSFDVVCMVELLEHVPDPLEHVAAAARLLRPGGLLYGTTPNGAGMSARVLGTRWSAVAAPEHLQLFAGRALRDLLTRNGFAARVRAEGVNPHELLAAGRGGRTVAAGERVRSGYELNEALISSAHGRVVKRAMNAALRMAALGDSLKFRAVSR